MSYDFPTGEVYGLNEEAIQAKKHVSGADGVPTAVTLTAVPITFRVDASRVDLASIWQDYDACRQREGGCGENNRAGASGGAELDALLEKNLLWAEAGDAERVTEEALLPTLSLVSAVGYDLFVSKKGFVELLRSLAGEVLTRRIECEATTRHLDDRTTKVGELGLKARLLAEEAGQVGALQ